ncbi:hypothetical protein EGR_10120 [Echinococcus granulosus]|uniref:Uncharacterized protein n=1 Tax=Echinococcus granulosus TaxID=6210 RepID=W6UNT0_ECHGR|nr:hypothetical protein EGR_10120 [Echinococcus granulosus]EUB55024.1 hypothetical protein EGR_10120 [Echinococcus granulosus]
MAVVVMMLGRVEAALGTKGVCINHRLSSIGNTGKGTIDGGVCVWMSVPVPCGAVPGTPVDATCDFKPLNFNCLTYETFKYCLCKRCPMDFYLKPSNAKGPVSVGQWEFGTIHCSTKTWEIPPMYGSKILSRFQWASDLFRFEIAGCKSLARCFDATKVTE